MKLKIGFALLILMESEHSFKRRPDENRRNGAAGNLNKVLDQIVHTPDRGIPDKVLQGAKCIAVVPSLLKGGFIIAGKHGRQVTTCRLPRGGWSAPAFFVISGGSWGAQIGVESIDLVMLAMTDEGMRHMMEDKFQIGGSISAAIGPVGRDAAAATDWKVDTQFLTYSRAKGLFAGIDLGGSVVEHDKDSTFALYNKEASTRAVLDGEVTPPAAARPFLAEVRQIKAHAHAKAEAHARAEADEHNR